MFLSDNIIPLVMILFGAYFHRHAPRKINYWFGYRTTMSMKNQDTWQFSHHYIGKLWWYFGWIALIPSVIALFLCMGKSEADIGTYSIIILIIQMIFMIFPIFLTERALHKTFDRDGNRR